jgi:FkbM family methyltransferase
MLDKQLALAPRRTTTSTRIGAHIPVVTSDIIQRYLYLFGEWEPHLTAWLKRRLKPGDTFIDVGANVGYYTLLAARLVGSNGHVVSIEPSPSAYATLTNAIEANRCSNVRSINAAASDTANRLTFYTESLGNLGGTSMVRPRNVVSSFKAYSRPLHELLKPHELETSRLIKIDVEGAEAVLVRGFIPHLDRLRPEAEVVIEVTPRLLRKRGEEVLDVLQPFLDRGFHVYRLTNDYAADSYPAAMRRPLPPERWTQPVTEMSDLILSRVDATHLF